MKKGVNMNKYKAQLAIAVVCAILGFLLVYQYKLQSGQKSNEQALGNVDLLSAIEQLNKEKDALLGENTELSRQLKEYEEMAASTSSSNKLLKEQLDMSRIILGLVDVEGPGVTVTLTPTNPIVSQGVPQYLTDVELVYVVNELKFAGAEAVSINDKRLTAQSGIKTSSGNSFILVNDEKVSPSDPIQIKAIGDRDKLMGALSFSGALDFQALVYYDIRFEPSDEVFIPKYGKTFGTSFAKPAEDPK